MYTIYDKYQLLELFESEPKVMDENAEIYLYSTLNKYGFKLDLYLSTYDMNVVITLKYKEINYPIFDISLSEVTKVDVSYKKLSVYKNNGIDPVVVISFEPNFRLYIP